MAASKTGSGKTLSYLIPIIERLYTSKWTVLDGLGALIILPTRELVTKFNLFKLLERIEGERKGGGGGWGQRTGN